jgi:hypothetical protein
VTPLAEWGWRLAIAGLRAGLVRAMRRARLTQPLHEVDARTLCDVGLRALPRVHRAASLVSCR